MNIPNSSKLCIAVLLVTLITLSTISCGGGGGGGTSGGGAPLTPASIDQTSSESTVRLAMISNELSDGLTSITDSFVRSASGETNESVTPLVMPLLRFIENKFPIAINGNARAGSLSTNESCYSSGSVVFSMSWDGPDNPVDCSQVSNLVGNFTLNNCGEFYPFIVDGTCSFTINGPLCNPTSISIQYTSYSISSSSQPDDYSMRSLSLNINNIQWSGDMVTHQSLVLDGDIQGNIHGHSFSAEFDDYTMDVSTTNDIDYSVELSGSITGGCLNGWVTVDTITPILVHSYSDCPTAGELLLSGEGDMSIIFYYDGSVDIGVIHYDSCNDVGSDCR